jgi:adenine specific DNA methylase Mod
VSGKIPFSERDKGRELTQLVQNGEVDEVVVEELSRLGRNTIDTLTTLKFFEEIITLPILQTSKEFELVLDPFMGSGTTGRVCDQLGRSFVGYDLKGY